MVGDRTQDEIRQGADGTEGHRRHDRGLPDPGHVLGVEHQDAHADEGDLKVRVPADEILGGGHVQHDLHIGGHIEQPEPLPADHRQHDDIVHHAEDVEYGHGLHSVMGEERQHGDMNEEKAQVQPVGHEPCQLGGYQSHRSFLLFYERQYIWFNI